MEDKEPGGGQRGVRPQAPRETAPRAVFLGGGGVPGEARRRAVIPNAQADHCSAGFP